MKIIELYSNIYLNFGNYNFITELKSIFFNEEKILGLYNNKYGRLLLFKLSRLLTPEEKNNIFNKANTQIPKDQNKVQVLVELFN